jgi:hypothetical protein
MIVLSQSIVLAPLVNPLGTPIFGLNNLVTIGNIAATSEAAGFPVGNLANPETYLRWRSAPGSPPVDQYVTVTFTALAEVDYVAVAVHNFGSGQVPVSVEAATALVGSPPAPNWAEVVQDTIPANDDPIIFRFTPGTKVAVRLRMQPGQAAPFAAVLYVGKLLVAERGTHAAHVPINFGRTTRVTNGRSENGQHLGRIVLSEARQTTFALNRLRSDWYRQIFDPFLSAVQETPFFFAWRPQAFPNDVGYCTVRNDPVPSVDFDTGTIALELQLSGVAVT